LLAADECINRKNAQITGPNNEVYYDELYFEGRGLPGYKTFLASSEGRYKFCFGNEMSRWTPKVATLTIKRLDDATVTQPTEERKPGAPGVDGELAKPEHIQPLQQSISKISNALGAIENEQSYYRRREHRHRNTAEETCERVQWWSIYETSVIVLISLTQVLILRRWFSK
jgi:hypothetical protein